MSTPSARHSSFTAASIGTILAAITLLLSCSVAGGSMAASLSTQANLSAALMAATHTTTLPSLVVPLTAIPVDIFNESNLCMVRDDAPSPLGTRPSDAQCTYGDVHASTSVVLFGDSHAMMWLSDLTEIALRDRFKLIVVARASCDTASIAQWSYQLKAAGTTCTEFRTWAINHIAGLHPVAVIVSDDAGAYQRGPLNTLIPRSAYDAAQQQTFTKLGAPHRLVIDLSNTPKLSIPAAICLSEHPTDVQRCNISLATALASVPADQQHNAAASGAKYLNTLSWLCTSTTCPVVVDHTLVYADDNHLTQHFTALIEPLIANALHRLGLP